MSFRKHFMMVWILALCIAPALRAQTDERSEEIQRYRQQQLKRQEIIKRLRERDPGLARPESKTTPLPRPRRLDMPIAKVDEREITYPEILEKFNDFVRRRPDVRERIDEGQAWIEFKNAAIIKLLNEWINESLLLLAADKKGVQISDSELQKQIQLMPEISLLGKDIEQVLEDFNISRRQFEKDLRENLTIEKFLRQQVTEQVEEQEMRQLYEQNRERFRIPESIYVITLFKAIKDKDGHLLPLEARESLRQEIETYRELATDVQAFVKLAEKYSDPPYNGQNAVLGWVMKIEDPEEMLKSGAAESGWLAQLVEERTRIKRRLNQFYFEQEVGEISPVLETEVGYHLAWIAGRQEARGDTYESVREDIVAYYVAGARDAIVNALRKTALVAVNLNGIDPNAPRQSIQPSTSQPQQRSNRIQENNRIQIRR